MMELIPENARARQSLETIGSAICAVFVVGKNLNKSTPFFFFFFYVEDKDSTPNLKLFNPDLMNFPYHLVDS